MYFLFFNSDNSDADSKIFLYLGLVFLMIVDVIYIINAKNLKWVNQNRQINKTTLNKTIHKRGDKIKQRLIQQFFKLAWVL
jgi:hypothetical protein